MTADYVCDGCGKPSPGWALVFLRGEGASSDLCAAWYSAEVALRMGLDRFEQPEFEPFAVEDSAGHEHTFYFLGRLAASGFVIDALEVRDGEPQGYRFSIMGPCEGSPYLLAGELRRRIRNSLAYRSLDRHEGKPVLPGGRPVFGTISYDSETGQPKLVIDGEAISWSDFGRMMQTCEGWQFRMEIRERMEGW